MGRASWSGIRRVKYPDDIQASCRPPRINPLSSMFQAADASYPDPERNLGCSCSPVIAARMQDLAVKASAQQRGWSMRRCKCNLTEEQWLLVSGGSCGCCADAAKVLCRAQSTECRTACVFLALGAAHQHSHSCSYVTRFWRVDWRALCASCHPPPPSHPTKTCCGGACPACAHAQVARRLGLSPEVVADIDTATCKKSTAGHKHGRDDAGWTCAAAANNSFQVSVRACVRRRSSQLSCVPVCHGMRPFPQHTPSTMTNQTVSHCRHHA